MIKKLLKVLTGIAVIGGIIVAPLTSINVAYAKNNRISIYEGSASDGLPTWYELDLDKIGEFDLHGIHYISIWLTELYDDGLFSILASNENYPYVTQQPESCLTYF